LTARGFEGIFLETKTIEGRVRGNNGKVKNVTLDTFIEELEEYIGFKGYLYPYVAGGKYITIKTLEDKILSKFTQGDGIGIIKSTQILEKKLHYIDRSGNKHYKTVEESEYCGNHRLLLSMDPDVFVIPNQKLYTDDSGNYVADFDTNTKTHTPDDITRKDEIETFALGKNNNVQLGRIRQILVNIKAIQKAFANVPSIKEGMDNLLQAINTNSLNY